MLQITDKLLAPSRFTAARAIAGLEAAVASVDAKDRDFLTVLAAACDEAGIDYAIAVSHCANETNLFRDDNWNVRLNPAGIGITGQPGHTGPNFPNATAAARFYVALLLLKIRKGGDIGAFEAERDTAPGTFDGTRAFARDATFPSVSTLDDLRLRFGPNGRECVWMCDQGGPAAIVGKAAILFSRIPGPDGAFSTAIPGLPGGPLTTDYPIHVDLIPFSALHRPGRKAKLPRRSVQHGNGNDDSSARGERNFLHGGARDDAGNEQTLSYHATADDREVFVLVPADEVTFQAADGPGPGNENGFSCEMVEDANLWAEPARRDRVIHVCADFMGRVAARLSIAEPERHWDFNWVVAGCPSFCETPHPKRHDCPNKLRHVRMPDGRLAWDLYAQRWRAAKADELQRMNPFPSRRIPIPAGATEIDITGVGLLPLRRNTRARFVATAEGTFFTAPSIEAPIGTRSGYRVGKICRFTHRAGVAGQNWLVSRAGSWAPAADFDRAED